MYSILYTSSNGSRDKKALRVISGALTMPKKWCVNVIILMWIWIWIWITIHLWLDYVSSPPAPCFLCHPEFVQSNDMHHVTLYRCYRRRIQKEINAHAVRRSMALMRCGRWAWAHCIWHLKWIYSFLCFPAHSTVASDDCLRRIVVHTPGERFETRVEFPRRRTLAVKSSFEFWNMEMGTVWALFRCHHRFRWGISCASFCVMPLSFVCHRAENVMTKFHLIWKSKSISYRILNNVLFGCHFCRRNYTYLFIHFRVVFSSSTLPIHFRRRIWLTEDVKTWWF